MKQGLSFLLFLSVFQISLHAQDVSHDSAVFRQISHHILTHYQCYEDLRYLCKHIGKRLSGSPQADEAVQWGKEVMEKMGCDRVFLQEVMVPHWVRGHEEASLLVKGHHTPLKISSLGNSVGTGAEGLTAPLLMVHDIEELKQMDPALVKGKIVFFDYRFDQTNINTFESYGPCVFYRWGAPSEASRLGAAAVIIRSVSSAYDDKPHTGSLTYNKEYPAIPAVAISNLAADDLEKTMQGKQEVRLYLNNTCHMEEDVKSYNVVGELRGSEKPDEIITVGGHLDSWDIGEGAHDDGTGVVQAMEVLRTFKELGIRPRRTLRAVLYMNEENGLRGGKGYAEWANAHQEHHILCIESDAGGGTPMGFSMEMPRAQREKIKSWAGLFLPYNIWSFDRDGGGADVGPMKKKFSTPIMELLPDSQRYFDVHHSDNDVFENVHRRELCLGAMALCQLVYMVNTYGL